MSDWIRLVGTGPEADAPADVAVFVETRDGKLGPDAHGILRLARLHADALGAYVVALIPGGTEGNALEASAYGADKVALETNLRKAVESIRPSVILFALTDGAVEPASRLAEVLQRSLIGPAVSTQVDPSTKRLVVRILAYGGKQIEEVTAGEWHPQMVAVDPDRLPPAVEDIVRL